MCGVVWCYVVLYCAVLCIICDAITHRCRLETSSSKHNTLNECILHYVCADCAFSSVECRYTTNMSIFKDFSHLMELKRAERDCLPAYLYTTCRNISVYLYILISAWLQCDYCGLNTSTSELFCFGRHIWPQWESTRLRHYLLLTLAKLISLLYWRSRSL